MTKSQLIDAIAERAPNVPRREVESIVNAVFESMNESLQRSERIEIRGFGSFGVKTRPARQGRLGRFDASMNGSFLRHRSTDVTPWLLGSYTSSSTPPGTTRYPKVTAWWLRRR